MLNTHYEFLITPIPSKLLQQGLIISHSIASLAVLLAVLPMVVKVGLLAWIALHFMALHKHLRRQSEMFRYTDAKGWEVLVDEQVKSINVLASSVITTKMVVLHYQCASQRCYFVVVYDALSEECYRQFVVCLKTTGLTR